MSELLITLAAVLLVCAAWELYTRRRRGHGLRGGDDDPAARPPQTAVPVESDLVRRLYATRTWSETRALLSDDRAFVAETWIRLVVTPCGTRIRELGPSSVVSR